MPPLPVVSGATAIQVFVALGWYVVRQRSSHVSLAKRGKVAILTIPLKKELGKGLLRDQIRKAGVTVEDFIAALKKQP